MSAKTGRLSKRGHSGDNDMPEQVLAAYASTLTDENAKLRAWRESAIKELGRWDKVHESLGKPGKLGESMAEASLVEVAKLRALVQVLVDAIAKVDEYSERDLMNTVDEDAIIDNWKSSLAAAKEQGFTPTNTTETPGE